MSRRSRAQAAWALRADTIRAQRIRQQPRHQRFGPGVIGLHSHDPAHCVCNGTHASRGFCSRCPHPYLLGGTVFHL